MNELLTRLKNEGYIPPDLLYQGLLEIMGGRVTPGQIGAFLMGLGPENETTDHIISAARAFREKAMTIKAHAQAVDCCGTGGDGLKTLNISTAVAIVAAGCGAVVAKHGNRAASSKSGAADILEALGLPLLSDPQILEKALHDTGFAFLMAPHHHTSMAKVAKIRKELGFRTMFNILGPLTNPAGASIQLLGVYDTKWLRPVCEALSRLGTQKALVVHGADGLDEISLSGPTYCAEWTGQEILEYELIPDSFNLPALSSVSDIEGGDPEYNARALRDLLRGTKSAYRDIVLANTAALLKLSTRATSLEEGVALAANAIDSGKANEVFENYKSYADSE